MYLTFYGLTEKPFNSTPDPKFLYMSSAHREALAQLLYGTQERKGFIVLTGKVGTGKTTLLHALRQRLNGQSAIAFVVNSGLSFDALLEYVLADLGIAKGGDSRAQRLIALNTFLIERERAGQNTVLIIDEAQNLDEATLEQIRMLSNFETPTSKLLQILLVGQPELKTRLASPELRQLKQRVGLRCQIPALTPEETRAYIRTRLRIAGARDLRLVRRHGGGPHLGILRRDSTAHQHPRRPLASLRLRRPEAPDRSARGESGDRISRGGHAIPAPAQGLSRHEDSAPGAVESRSRGDGARERRRGARPRLQWGHAEDRPVSESTPAMSTFFKALERAEQDRALRRAQEASPEPTGEEQRAVSPSATEPAPPTESASRQPTDAASPRDEGANGLDEHLVSLIAPSSFEAEQYRALRHMIEQLHRSEALSVIAISSADAGDGKTTTTINLAGALAQAADARVLVVDADLRGANVATDLGIDEAPGLVDLILRTDLALETAVQVCPDLNLSVLPAGRRPSAPYEVLKSPRVADLLAEARQKYDFVIIDTSPLVTVPDSRVAGEVGGRLCHRRSGPPDATPACRGSAQSHRAQLKSRE